MPVASGTSAPVDPSTLLIHPAEGRFSFKAGVPVGTITTNYYFGLLSGVVNAFEVAAPPDGDKLPA